MSKRSTYVSALSPEYAVLGFLAQQPAHGYDLHQRLLSELGQVWHIGQSQLYNLLKRLEAQGDIVAALQEQSRLPDRRVFHLTGQGRARFEKWMETPTGSSVRAIRVEFITRLYFARLQNPDLAARLILVQMDETRLGLERLRRKLENLPPEQLFNRLGLELRVRQLNSVLDWLEESRTILDNA
jgi:DNA-binding PadR family transcriptional regulator